MYTGMGWVLVQFIVSRQVKPNRVTFSGKLSALLEPSGSLQPINPMFLEEKEYKCIRGYNCRCFCVKSKPLEANTAFFV